MIAVIARLKVQDGKGADLETAMAGLAATVREKEPGCTLYKLCKAQEANTYVMLERYIDQAAVDAHMQTPHFTAILPKFGALLAGAPEIEVLTELG